MNRSLWRQPATTGANQRLAPGTTPLSRRPRDLVHTWTAGSNRIAAEAVAPEPGFWLGGDDGPVLCERSHTSRHGQGSYRGQSSPVAKAPPIDAFRPYRDPSGRRIFGYIPKQRTHTTVPPFSRGGHQRRTAPRPAGILVSLLGGFPGLHRRVENGSPSSLASGRISWLGEFTLRGVLASRRVAARDHLSHPECPADRGRHRGDDIRGRRENRPHQMDCTDRSFADLGTSSRLGMAVLAYRRGWRSATAPALFGASLAVDADREDARRIPSIRIRGASGLGRAPSSSDALQARAVVLDWLAPVGRMGGPDG